jgi:organic hydroperoxide reductase OsmC/OhrA
MAIQTFPHHYAASAAGAPEGPVALSSEGVPALASGPPQQFGGAGDRWSPELLLVAAVADCFVLTFRAVAGASQLEWDTLRCEVDGVLDRIEHTTAFTEFQLRVLLHVPQGTDPERAARLLAKAEQNCLITNSLKARTQLETRVEESA